MPNVSLVEETDKLFDTEWLKEVNSEGFVETAKRYHRNDGIAVLRIFGYFVKGERSMTLLVQDHQFMLEILELTVNVDIPVSRMADRLLRYTNRYTLLTYSQEYSETYITMGLPIKTVNYARPIIPGAQPDPERFTSNIQQLYQSQDAFMSMAMSLFHDADAVRHSLQTGGRLSLLVLESGRQIITLLTPGTRRWIVSRPFYTDDFNEQLNDADFGRLMRNLGASLPKGDLLVYTSHLNGKGNRATWLLSNGFVPESYIYEKTIEES